MSMDLTTQILRAVAMSGGITISLSGEVPTTGYFVGGFSDPLILDLADMVSNNEDDERITQWISNSPMLQRHDCYIGAWLDTKTVKVWFDVSRCYPTADEALAVGREHGELAIWDMENQAEIRIDYQSVAA